MGLDRGTLDPFDLIAPVVEPFFRAVAEIHARGDAVPYNPVTDTAGGFEDVVVASGLKARVQQINNGSQYAGIYDPTTQVLYRIQLVAEHRGGAKFDIKRGNTVKITDGANNREIERFVFTVQAFGNSDHIQVRDLVCTVDVEQARG